MTTSSNQLIPSIPRGFSAATFDAERGYTMLAIPKTATAPPISGALSDAGWEHAAVINVMADQHSEWNALYARSVRWLLLWDEDHLYLRAESPRLPRENLVCNFRDQSVGGWTVMDDSVEIHLTPGGRNVVGKSLPWSGQAILNPLGVGYYSKFTWEVAARTTTWVPDWQMGSTIHEDAWVLELGMPRETLSLPQPNRAGDVWSLLLARNWKSTGWNQATLPAKLYNFQLPQEQPLFYLTDGAYAQLTDLSGLFDGKLATTMQLGTCGDTAETLTVTLIVDSHGEETPAFHREITASVTVQPGQLTPWELQEDEILPAGEYRYHLTVTSQHCSLPVLELQSFFRPGGADWLEKAAARLQAHPYTFQAQLAPTVGALLVMADFFYSPDPEAVTTLAIQVQAPDGAVIYSGQSTNMHARMIRDTCQLPPLTPGTYNWTMQLLNAAGEVLAQDTGVMVKKDEAAEFPWWNFAGGNVDRVLWPFEAIQVENGGAESSYWGGKYYLNGLCLPRQLQVTANEDWWPELLRDRPSVLARAVTMVVEQDGRPKTVAMQSIPRTTRVTDWEAGLRGFGQVGQTVEIESNASFAQDGLLWVNITLRPSMDSSSGQDIRRASATLDRLTIDIPLREEVARSIVAHGQPGYGSYTIKAVPEGDGLLWDCTQVGRSVLTEGDMLPVIWVGNDQRGLTVFTENTSGWEQGDTPDQQLLRQSGEVVLRLNIIQRPITLNGDRSISFGLLPTPLRKLTPGWRMLESSFDQNFFNGEYERVGRMVKDGDFYNASIIPYSYQKSREMLFSQSHTLLTHPGGYEFAPHTERGDYESITRDTVAQAYFGPEWKQNTWTPAFQDHVFWQLQQWIDRGGLTGFYHDQFYPQPTTNTITGAAYLLADGRTNPGYNLLRDRAYNIREYALFLENGITPRIFCHTTNSGQLISYPWVTTILDGEDNVIVSNADYDFVDIYPPERMQAYGTPWNLGTSFYWMRLIQQGEADWQLRQARAYQGWTILHDVMFNNENVFFTSGPVNHRTALFDWGMNDDNVRFWPYWRMQGLVHASDPRLLVSLWTLPDRALVCVYNTDKSAAIAGATIRLPLQDLGLMPHIRAQYLTASDLEGNEVTFDAWNGEFTCDIKPHDFRLLSVRIL